MTRAAESTMEERLAATTASLKQSIQRMKEITARSKSTDATLARIARMQASWAPTEEVVQESMERRRDSFARNMDAAAQALARISGAMVSTPTSSTTAHHDTEKAVQVTTPTTPLSAASTVANLDFSCRQEKRMDELSSSINTNLAAVASLQKGMECCWDSTQVPATTTESTRLVPASVLAAHLLLTDRMVATRDPERVLRIGAPKVFEEIPSKPSAADTMKEADTTLAWCRQLVPTTVARIAGSQLDPFICADQVPRAMGKRSSSRGGDDSRGRSAYRRSSGEQGGNKEQGSVSLLVRNIPHDCSSDLLAAFQKFGHIKDFYIPKDYYSGEPRGFAFIEFLDSRDASEAQRHMHHKMLCGREINVVPATAKRRRPDHMRRRTGDRGQSDYKGRHLSRLGRSRTCSRSRSPRHGVRDRSRSHSPAPRRPGDYSASPKRKEECQEKSSGQSKEHDKGKKQGSCTPCDRSDCRDADNGSNERRATPDYSAAPKRMEEYRTKSPRHAKNHDEDKKQRSYTPADRNDCREAGNGHNGRDDYSTSAKGKEERLAKSPRWSKEHDMHKKRRSYSRDDGNDCCDADIDLKERRATTDGEASCPRQRSPRPSSGSHSRRRDDYSASPKGKEEHQEQSPSHLKEYDKCKKRRSDTPDNRKDCCDADHSYNEMQDGHPTSPKIKEERQAKLSGESKEYDKDTKQRSYAPHDRNDLCDADNGSKVSNVHVDRKQVTPDGEGSHAGQRSPRPSTSLSSRRQDDYSASAKRKEELRSKSPKQSNEHEDKKRRSYTPDDKNDRRDANSCNEKKQDDYSASPKRKEECQASSPRQTEERKVNRRSYAPDDRIARHKADNDYNERCASPDNGSPKRTEEARQAKSHSQSNEHDNDKKQRSYTRDNRKDSCNADNGSKEQNDYSASGNKKEEEHGANFPRKSKEHDENKTRASLTPDDRNDHHDTDNGSKERRDDNLASRRKMEDHRAKSPRQSKEHENDKRRSYTHDDRKDHCDADNGSRERRDDYPPPGNRKEEPRAKSPRQSKEHDDSKKRGSFTPDDRSDHHDTDNGSKTRDDSSTSRKRMEDHCAKSPRQSKEHENDKMGSYHDRKDRRDAANGSRERDDNSSSRKRFEENRAKSLRQSEEHENDKRGSYTHDDRKDRRDAANGSREGRDDNSASRKRMEDDRAKSPRQSKEHESDKKRGSYTHDDRKDRHAAANGSRERDDNSASRKRMEDDRAKSPRQSKEHEDDKKRGSYTHNDRKDRHDAANGSRERDDNSASRKRLEDDRPKSPRQSKEHGNDKKRGSYTHDDRKDRRDAANGSRERRDDNSASRKRMEDDRAKSPRQSKERENDKKRGSYTHNDRKDCRDADNGSRERRDDNSASRKRVEDDRAKSPRQSKEHENDKERGSYTHNDRKDCRDADNGSRERRDDNSASRKRMEDDCAKSPGQSKEHETDKKMGSYTRDDRNGRCDADNSSRGRDDYSASRKRKEECQGESSRRSKEHDANKMRGSYAPDDRNDRHDADNTRNDERKLATHDRGGGRHLSPRRRSPRPSSGPRSRSADKIRGRHSD